MPNTDVTIIGAGPVGLFAVFQAGMLGMSCVVVDALDEIGGQCSALYPQKPIYDIPAYPKILASDLIEQLNAQAAPFKPSYFLGTEVIGLQEDKENHYILTTSSKKTIKTKVVLIAAGAGSFGPNRPPLKNIEEYENKSIFYLVKKREQFAGKTIVIAGGGDSAVDWAISLAEITKKIYLVHRRDKFRAASNSVAKIKSLADQGKIELVIGYQLSGLEGENGMLKNVIVSDLNNNSVALPAEYLLPFFGLSQDLGPITKWGLNLKTHHIEASYPYFETNSKGIYAIGDVVTYPGKLKLILTGFAEAASALHHAYERVFDGRALHFEYSTTKGANVR